MVGRKDARRLYLTGLDEALKTLVETCYAIQCVNCNNSLCALYCVWKRNVLHLCLSLVNTLQL